jgi:hypothetical protein
MGHMLEFDYTMGVSEALDTLEVLTEALGERGLSVGEDTGLTALLQVVGVLLGGGPGDTDPGNFRRTLMPERPRHSASGLARQARHRSLERHHPPA